MSNLENDVFLMPVHTVINNCQPCVTTGVLYAVSGCPVLETLRNRNIGQPLPRQRAQVQ